MLSKMLSDIKMPPAHTIVTTAASVAASAMVIRSIARDLVPYELQQYVYSSINSLLRSFSSEVVLIIEEFDGLGSNKIYKAAEIYLGSKVSPLTRMFTVSMPEKENKITTRVAKNQQVVDSFNGAVFKWRQITTQVESNRRGQYPGGGGDHTSQQTETRCYKLCFHKKHKRMVFESYIPFIINESKNIRQENKTLRIHTLAGEHFRRYSGDYAWNSIKLDHPATFDTLAMEEDLKKMIVEDLEKFVSRREYYRNVGKAWKRGYLLYGPPGTGKSSLIAAMANYLKFDIYDLELNDIRANSDLRRLLINTANRSILVVEDIDCTLEFQDRKAEERALRILKSNQVSQAQTVNIVREYKPNQVTLSGLLNFIDGLWSSCGDERIIIFTTNHKDRLDPALLRPGRMDLHIHMSYCSPCAFKTLAANYLGVSDHPLFEEIDAMLETTKVTPAEVGEQLLRNGGLDAYAELDSVITFLVEKKRENDELEAKRLQQEEEEKEENVAAQGSKSVENRPTEQSKISLPRGFC